MVTINSVSRVSKNKDLAGKYIEAPSDRGCCSFLGGGSVVVYSLFYCCSHCAMSLLCSVAF